MRVLYLVGNYSWLNTGQGGHYYTARTIAETFSRDFGARLVSHGTARVNALPPDTLHVYSGWTWPFDVVRQLVEIVQQEKIDILHALDSTSLLVARLASLRSKIPFAWTKCGGAVTEKYTPCGWPDIVFHEEDYEHYEVISRDSSRPVMLIPNRVAAGITDNHAANLRRTDSINVMRIGRICQRYKRSFEATIHLVEQLNANGVAANAILIGYPEDSTVVADLKQKVGDQGMVFTDPSITTGAARHLKEADIVVASGRGVMEAALLGKIVCFESRSSDLPVLLSRHSLGEGLRANFSPRASVAADRGVLTDLTELATDPDRLARYKEWLADVCRQSFDLLSAVPKYESLYNRTRLPVAGDSAKDRIEHFCRLFAARVMKTQWSRR